VEVLDALSIGISLARGDFSTASSVRFLLGLGELLEEWTHKKSVSDLAQCMSLNIDRVWLKTPQGDVLTPLSQIQTGDLVCVRLGGMIPLDGVINQGEVMVNQASLTGESVPVPKRPDMTVYAGTEVIPFGGQDETEMLRLAACLEGHFPHSMANAVVRAARERYDAQPDRYSHLYLAIGGVLAALCLRSLASRREAKTVIRQLRELGIEHAVMLTGDSERTAAASSAWEGAAFSARERRAIPVPSAFVP